MTDFFIPALIGFSVALSVVIAIKMFRNRNAQLRPPAPEMPLSRQHQRAIERRANKRG